MAFPPVRRRRLALIPLTLLGVSAIVFVLARIIPGDPAQLAAGDQATPAMVEAFRKEYRLDRPSGVQYVAYLGGLLRGDLGRSMFTGRPVRATCGPSSPPRSS